MNYRILNTIGSLYTKEAKDILDQLGTTDYTLLTQDELRSCIHLYDVVVMGLGLHFNKDVLQKGKNIKVLVTSTTGTDHIDMAYAKERGIVVISLKDDIEFLKTVTSTAELAWGLLIDLARGISRSFESVTHYEWNRERFRGVELRGKTLGIVGLGRLGAMVAQYGRAFGMHVVATDPHLAADAFANLGVQSVSFDELLGVSDVISIHVHLTPETTHLFSTTAFENMKPTALLVNTARGNIVDEVALLDALQNNRFAGYATDVLDGEVHFHESFVHHPVIEYAKQHSNVVVTPHIGGMTHESRSRTDIFAAEKLRSWVQEHGASTSLLS